MDVPIDFVIRSASAADPEALRAYAERRLAFALRRFESRARRVFVRLSDTNGDGVADLTIHASGITGFIASDFLL